MELELGRHCFVQTCKLLDYLPIKCEFCKHFFCSEHSAPESHDCSVSRPNAIAPTCPLCNQIISVPAGTDPNIIVNNHISKGCPEVVRKNTATYACSMPRCRKKELIAVICPFCKLNFCFRHRAAMDHKCTNNPTMKAQEKGGKLEVLRTANAETQRRIQMAVSGFLKSRSQKPAAAKIAAMKMRHKAKGDSKIAPERRYYLEVMFPFEKKIQPKHLYFDQEWVLGKVLDEAASFGNLKNSNNVTGAKKLGLYSLKTGNILQNGTKLKDVADSELRSGDSILLEWVTAH